MYFSIGCRNWHDKQLNHLIWLLIVSCRAWARPPARKSDWDTALSGRRMYVGSPLYPRSASTIAPGLSFFISLCQNIFMSGHLPQGYGPFTQTMWPVWIQTAILYLNPAFLNLWEYNFELNGFWSLIGQSVPSTVTRQVFSLLFTSLFFHFTW